MNIASKTTTALTGKIRIVSKNRIITECGLNHTEIVPSTVKTGKMILTHYDIQLSKEHR